MFFGGSIGASFQDFNWFHPFVQKMQCIKKEIKATKKKHEMMFEDLALTTGPTWPPKHPWTCLSQISSERSSWSVPWHVDQNLLLPSESPFVAKTSKTPLSMVNTETAKVPPPKWYTKMFASWNCRQMFASWACRCLGSQCRDGCFANTCLLPCLIHEWWVVEDW